MSTPVRNAKGRGAQSNATGRYEAFTRGEIDDGWDATDAPKPLRTELTAEAARTIISRNDSPDLGFDRTINPYRGCEHGCIYCYARPSHAYLGLSPGLDFESKLFFKPEAARLLERELSNPRYRCERIQLGANTDPYQPIERTLQITRQVLTVLDRFNHPVGITTKSALVTRDIDLLASMAERNLSKVAVSVTTLDRKLARAMEPRCATPDRRIEAIRALSSAGVPVIVSYSPVIPGLNDHEMESVLERAAAAGAREATMVLLRLPLEIKDLFVEWLEAERPDRAKRVMSLLRQSRGGAIYKADFGVRMGGEGPVYALIAQRFAAACKRYGLSRGVGPLETGLFRRPAAAGDQLSLL
jgi:DNA repair photolyase